MTLIETTEQAPNSKGDPLDFPRAVPFLGLLMVLSIRCLFGLDITDEMQYLGQILGLIESGQLFSNDLFIQQQVYLLFLPAFKLYHLVFGEMGFVLFGRLLLALILIGVYGFVRKSLLELNSSRWQAGLAAFAVTFAIPYHGIFALSYNTVSQCAWVIFLFWFIKPLDIAPWKWAALLLVAALAHPVAALSMALMLGLAMCRSWRAVRWLQWASTAFIALILLAELLVQFSSVADLKRSIAFSQGFGVGGQALWGNSLALCAVIGYVGFLAALAATPNRLQAPKIQPWLLAVTILLLTALQGFLLARREFPYSYSFPLSFISGMTAICAFLLARRVRADDQAPEALALRPAIIVGAVHFLVLVGTSSNGLAQGMGSLMVTIPTVLALVNVRLLHPVRWAVFIAYGPLCAAVLFAIVQWSVAPYRDYPWYKPGRSTSDTPAFRHLSLAAPTSTLLNAYDHEFGGELRGHKVLIASERPGLYFALGVTPQTCMLYMHSSGNAVSTRHLKECLNSRQPEFILDVHEGAADTRDTPLRQMIQEQVLMRGMSCREGLLYEHWLLAPGGAKPVRYRLCQRTMAASNSETADENLR